MITMDGYITIGHIEITADASDRAGDILLLVDPHGNLHRLDAFGCTCCDDSHEQLTEDNIRPVTGTFMELATDLYDNAHSNVDTDDKLQAENAVRDALLNVAELPTWQAAVLTS